ncbi:MAG TPA: AI-2E family transporter [Caulobacteraceae bacterium]|nr:AI-2E family transporter [Caulobacteraceae bacterium]
MAEARPSDPTARNALVVIAVVAVGAVVYWLNAILTPLALALFLAIMIDGFARVLRHRAHFPHVVALPLAIVIGLVISVLVAFIVANNAAGFVSALYGYEPKFDDLIVRFGQLFHVQVPPTVEALIQQLNPSVYVGQVAQGVSGFAASAMLVMIYVGFLMAARQGFELKARRLFRKAGERHHAGAVFLRVRNAVERYLWLQTVAAAIIAVGSWGVMATLGLSNALFWAFLIFLLTYIPIIGGILGVIGPTLFALVQFEGWWRALALLIGLQSIGFVVGSIIYPRMQGKNLNIDPLVVLLALAFWGAVWGLPGMILSTPLTVVAMVVLAQFDGTRWIAILLSADGDPLGAGVQSAKRDAGEPVGGVAIVGPPPHL